MKTTSPDFKAILFVEEDHVVRWGEWWLDAREAYLFGLLRNVTANVYWADPIKEFVKDPTKDRFYNLMDALADQYVDNALPVRQVLGEELAMQLPVYRMMRAWERRIPTSKVRDLRDLPAGTEFRFEPHGEYYVVTAKTGTQVRYRLAEMTTHPVLKYQKEFGMVAVHTLK